LVFGEADRLPGLVIDRYRLQGGHQVWVIQAHTAGADRVLESLLEILPDWISETLGAEIWNRTSIVVRNDLGVRKMEGLQEEPVRVVREITGVNLGDCVIEVKPVVPPFERPVLFSVDLLGGQKTGFFLDQYSNIQWAVWRLSELRPQGKVLKIIDLCCYVGQWGVQLARYFKSRGISVEVLAVDASEKALQLAKQNVEREGARCETLQADVLKGLVDLPTGGFDLVICDPPALIKSKKDAGPGAHAYLQLNTQAARLVRRGGGWVSCSCSAQLGEEEFSQALTKAAARNQLDVRWLGRGSPAPDHPMLTEFPEGRYLKCWIGGVL
jgi:23S rRNA (cytosine1962-C5)-methyltransferase